MKKTRSTLERIPADRSLVERLYFHRHISKEAREYALSFLYPRHYWELWVSRGLLTIGVSLILFGVVCFFAFNWESITSMVKMFSIQLGIIACLTGACFYSLKSALGKVLLLSGSVLVGVFMAVFGQAYQTGANAYQLFATWSILIFGWTLVSNFSAQWILWLVITNISLVLWWRQSIFPDREMASMIFVCVSILNGVVLALREYLIEKEAYAWLRPEWIRIMLVTVVLFTLLIPIMFWINRVYWMDLAQRYTTIPESLILSSLFGIVGYVVIYYIYRHKLPDLKPLVIAIFFGCITLEFLASKILFGRYVTHVMLNSSWRDGSTAIVYLIMAMFTLVVFTTAAVYLRNVSRRLREKCLNI